jgi:hypothetical protein
MPAQESPAPLSAYCVLEEIIYPSEIAGRKLTGHAQPTSSGRSIDSDAPPEALSGG